LFIKLTPICYNRILAIFKEKSTIHLWLYVLITVGIGKLFVTHCLNLINIADTTSPEWFGVHHWEQDGIINVSSHEQRVRSWKHGSDEGNNP